MKIQFINEDVRKVLTQRGKRLAGKNEWTLDIPNSESFIIIRLNGNPIREVDAAEVVSWSFNGRDTMEYLKEIHKDIYHQTYMDMLHALISPMRKRV